MITFLCIDCSQEFRKTSNRQIRCSACKRILVCSATKKWYSENKDRKASYDKQRREEKRHLYREASKRHRINNPAKKKADVITRRLGIKQRTPIWANLKYMNLFYKLAKVEETRTNKKVHVDHIYPLKADWVCGLHCEDNLQLLFADDNIRKSNHYSLEWEGKK